MNEHKEREALSAAHAVVTGASRGIGAAIATALVANGSKVTLMARNGETLAARAARLEKRFGSCCHAVVADVTVAAEVKAGFKNAREAFGPVDTLINNVGGVEMGLFVDTSIEDLKRMIDLNLSGVFFCCQEVLPDMMKNGAGRIVNIASTAALQGYPYVSAYTAAKHAVVGLTRALALEATKYSIGVNAICPGFTDTALLDESAEKVAKKAGKSVEEIRTRYAESNPSGRLIDPVEVAEKVVWLCRPEQAQLTGQAIRVDGSSETEG